MKKIELPKAYNAKEYEDKIYNRWEKSGYFDPDVCVKKKVTKEKAPSFTISMPPPNATGELHIGHAMMLGIQDLMVRYHRMKGERTLWLPGEDHAAIATQTKVEKMLKKEGKNKYDLGREKFLARVEEYVADSRDTIRNQIRKMGSSCDWSRERYTMDKGLTKAVQTQFINMYNDGLIYRGDRIVNWCPRCESTLADDEVEYKKEKGKFYYIKYGPVVIGTARPETKFLDKTIIVHPEDKRYKKIVGKKFMVPWINGEVEANVIADEAADMETGSGAMTITPAHSFIDFELAKKYKLPIVQIIDEKGNLTEQAGEFKGMNANKAREAIVKKMEEKGLIEKIDEQYEHNLSVCYRCGTAIEPLVSKQWFIDVNKKFSRAEEGTKKSIKERSIGVVKNEEIKIIPKRFEKIYYHWMENLRDWCISRQIWFGHRIPVWYKIQDTCLQDTRYKIQFPNKSQIPNSKDDKDIKVQIESPGKGWEQDPDTLDTWFSSGLWTFSTLGWPSFAKATEGKLPEKFDDLKEFHPTSVMETGYDILFFWIARMIIMSTYALGGIPFETVYLHGLVRDKKGRKMSKSLGNGIDPIEVIEKYGADATRLSLLIGVTAGNDVRLFDEKIAGYRNFVNKLWNISRYILMSVDDRRSSNFLESGSNISNNFKKLNLKNLTLSDKWILSEMNGTVGEVTKGICEFQFSRAGEVLYEFTWTKLADWYLEIAKIPTSAPDGATAGKGQILMHILTNLLKLWHPFMPYVTEEIWGRLSKDLLMVEKWPVVDEKLIDLKVEDEFGKLQELVVKIRNARAEKKIEPKEIVKVKIKSKEYKKLVDEQGGVICGLGRVEVVEKGETLIVN